MTRTPLFDDFLRSLIDFNRAMRSQGAAWTSLSAELSRNELILLGLLADGEVARGSQVSERMGVGPSVISRLVTALDARGLIERSTDPEDRRAEVLALTDSGREQLRRARAAYVEILAARLGDWDEQRVAEATRTLIDLREALMTHD